MERTCCDGRCFQRPGHGTCPAVDPHPPEGRIATNLPTFVAAGRTARAVLSKTWVTASLVLMTAGSVGSAIVFAALSVGGK